ncbi:hypothetical protein EAI_04324 [Harpegnathos saltator]|uniref:Uncharacterized protein n=1 Tax=Harpegnathos saltator TaxID=610380 RepID=E2C6T7_HARSA|nr:hypothetical protein EAI_04324 [Harpegnathos saltator]
MADDKVRGCKIDNQRSVFAMVHGVHQAMNILAGTCTESGRSPQQDATPSHCPEPENMAQHTLERCPAWIQQRHVCVWTRWRGAEPLPILFRL